MGIRERRDEKAHCQNEKQHAISEAIEKNREQSGGPEKGRVMQMCAPRFSLREKLSAEPTDEGLPSSINRT